MPSSRFTDEKSLPLYMGAEDIASLFGKSRRTAERWMAAGDLGQCIEIAGTRYLERSEFLKGVKRNRTARSPTAKDHKIAIQPGRPHRRTG